MVTYLPVTKEKKKVRITGHKQYIVQPSAAPAKHKVFRHTTVIKTRGYLKSFGRSYGSSMRCVRSVRALSDSWPGRQVNSLWTFSSCSSISPKQTASTPTVKRTCTHKPEAHVAAAGAAVFGQCDTQSWLCCVTSHVKTPRVSYALEQRIFMYHTYMKSGSGQRLWYTI